MQKKIIYISISCSLIAMGYFYLNFNSNSTKIGGYECLTNEGYVFNEIAQVCLKESEMTPDIINAVKTAREAMDSDQEYGINVVSFNSYEEAGSYDIIFELYPSGERKIIRIVNNKADFESYRTILSGIFLCLPHKDTTGPQTEECAHGIKTDNGIYYAIDLALMSQEHKPLASGNRISASGLITPIERLSTDHWRKYPITGIFSVTDSLEIIDAQ